MNDDHIAPDSIEATLATPPHYNVDIRTRERTPDMAVQNFDGGFDTVHAREVQTRCCNRGIANFVVGAAVVLAVLVTCMVLLAVRGFEAAGSAWLQAMVSFCIGVFVPSPRIKKSK